MDCGDTGRWYKSDPKWEWKGILVIARTTRTYHWSLPFASEEVTSFRNCFVTLIWLIFNYKIAEQGASVAYKVARASIFDLTFLWLVLNYKINWSLTLKGIVSQNYITIAGCFSELCCRCLSIISALLCSKISCVNWTGSPSKSLLRCSVWTCTW